MSAVDEVIALAKEEVGYLEKKTNSDLYSKTGNAGSNNYTKYAYELDKTDLFNGNKNGYPWCTCFYVWLLYHLFGVEKTRTALYLPVKSMAAGCYYAVQYYKAAGKYGSAPALGAQIFFDDSDGDPGHTGIVYGYDSSTVYTVEGNTSGASGVIANGGGVCKKSYSRSYSRIDGYGYPDWSVLTTDKYTAGWHKDDQGWWYAKDTQNYAASEWLKIDGEWYYFDGEGYMLTNQWKTADGQCYYLGTDGTVVRSRTVMLDENGKLVPGCGYYYKLGDVPEGYRKELDKLVEAGKLKGKGGSGDDMILDMTEDAVRVLIITNR